MKRTPQHDWKPYKPATKCYKHNWNKHWPGSNRMYRKTRNLHNEFLDPPEQSKPFKPWKPQLPSSDRTNPNQNTRFQNMPLETDAGNDHQLFTQCLSRISSFTMSRRNTTKTRSWGTKWHKWYGRIPNWQKKFQAPTRHLQRNSRRTPSWLWLPRQWPRTCSSNTTMGQNKTLVRRMSPHGENHFSKRRSESEIEGENENKNKERMIDSKTKESKRTKQKVKVKAEKAKAIKRPKSKIRIELKRQQDKIRQFQALEDKILKYSFHLHLAAIFIISILLFNSVLLDHFDHHFMYSFHTFTSKDFKDCGEHFSLQTKALQLARAARTSPAILGSMRLPRNPETRPNILTKDLHRNTLVPVELQQLGQPRTSESNIQIDSFLF